MTGNKTWEILNKMTDEKMKEFETWKAEDADFDSIQEIESIAAELFMLMREIETNLFVAQFMEKAA